LLLLAGGTSLVARAKGAASPDCSSSPPAAGATCRRTGSSPPAAAPAAPPAAAASVPTVIEILSSSCSACRRMEPVVAQASRRCAGPTLRVERRFVDDEEGATYARRLGVFGIPTFLLLDGEGREVTRLVGERPLAELEGAMEKLSGARCRS